MNEPLLAPRTGTLDTFGPPGPSAVSWAAILAGAAAAAALSLILLILGMGLGLSSVSPWSTQGISGAAFGVSTIVWISFTQIAASGMGGYLAGRLRVRWLGTDVDEVYFRDTAHGLLAWAVATLATAALLTSTIGAIVSGGVPLAGAAAATAAAPAASAAMARAPGADQGSGYFVDSLFRPASAPDSAASAPSTTAAPPTAEVGRIFVSALADGNLPADDTRYLAQLTAQKTGLAPAEAEKRVADTFARMKAKAAAAETAAREAADRARKASAYAALWLFVSLLIGAFVASLAATFGGRQRDLI